MEGELLEHLPPPALPKRASAYADVVRELELDAAERLVLILAYAPHVRPGLLDAFLIENKSLGRPVPPHRKLSGRPASTPRQILGFLYDKPVLLGSEALQDRRDQAA